MTSTAIPHLGQIDASPTQAVIARAARIVGPRVHDGTHTVLTWHDRADIARASAEGRLVAKFVVRYGDPDCYVARLPYQRLPDAAEESAMIWEAMQDADEDGEKSPQRLAARLAEVYGYTVPFARKQIDAFVGGVVRGMTQPYIPTDGSY